ncbi:MAG: hypothetical protein MRERC_4c049 [Mycoplasmataceae bacterium RC_NB112A]|nr:MAG: hypothetical protein MRERC_4c049 [Mycoplasmataceae bacterium RC_NB112A]
MLFSIQKKSFFKLYRYYLKKLRWSLLFLVANSILFLLNWKFNFRRFLLSDFSDFRSTFQIFFQINFSLFFSELGLLAFTTYTIYKLSGISGFFKKSQKTSEDAHVLLFSSPINRQTVVAAKLGCFTTYFMIINLVGLILPSLIALRANVPISVLTLLVFVLFSILFSVVNFCLVVPAFFYFSVNYSWKILLLGFLYLIGVLLANWMVFIFPLLTLLLFFAAVIAGIFFTYFNWKIFSSQDLEC